MLRVALAILAGGLLAQAGSLTFTSPMTVNGTDAFSGPSFPVSTGLSSTDMLNIRITGTVCLQPSGTFCTNGSGVLLVAGDGVAVGQDFWNTPGGSWFGSLLIGNSTLGFFPVVLPSAATGLGGVNPPLQLDVHATVGSIGFTSGIPAGSTLEFRISDFNTGDNSGSFTVRDITGPRSADVSDTPEPSTIVLMATGAGLLALYRRRR